MLEIDNIFFIIKLIKDSSINFIWSLYLENTLIIYESQVILKIGISNN